MIFAKDVYTTPMERSGGVIRIGPAGWSYEDWKGVVYPPDIGRTHPLAYLSRFFDTVEVNSSFYRPPDPKHAERWVRETASNESFMFSVKLWQRFTHERNRPFEDEDVHVFQEGVRPIHEAGKLGAILIQFPWSFKRTDENRLWLARVAEQFQAYPLAVEIRHDSWEKQEVLDSLKNHNICFCNIDQPIFDHSVAPTEYVTAPIAYVRLHGRNHDAWFRSDASRDERYDYLYADRELDDWAARIDRIREGAQAVYVVTNNHYRGQAVANAFQLQDKLHLKDVDPPKSLRVAFPQLEAVGAHKPEPTS